MWRSVCVCLGGGEERQSLSPSRPPPFPSSLRASSWLQTPLAVVITGGKVPPLLGPTLTTLHTLNAPHAGFPCFHTRCLLGPGRCVFPQAFHETWQCALHLLGPGPHVWPQLAMYFPQPQKPLGVTPSMAFGSLSPRILALVLSDSLPFPTPTTLPPTPPATRSPPFWTLLSGGRPLCPNTYHLVSPKLAAVGRSSAGLGEHGICTG